MRFIGRIRQFVLLSAAVLLVGCAGSPAARSPWRVQRVQPVPATPMKPVPSQKMAPQLAPPRSVAPNANSPRPESAPLVKEKLVPTPTPDPQTKTSPRLSEPSAERGNGNQSSTVQSNQPALKADTDVQPQIRFKPAPLGSSAEDEPTQELKIESQKLNKPSEEISPPRLGFESLNAPSDSPLKIDVTSRSKRPLGEAVTFDVVVTNESEDVLKDVVVDVDFDRHLVFPGRDEKQLQKNLGELLPGQSQKMLLTLVSDSLGQHACRFEASAEGLPSVKRTTNVTFVEPKLKLQLIGPERRTVGSRAEFTIKVANTSDQPIDDLKVTLNHDAALAPREATGGYQREATALHWTLGKIAPGEGVQMQAEFECRQMAENACVTVKARSESSAEEEIETCVTVVAVPGLLDLRISDRTDPVQTGQEAEYEVTVQNLGLQAISDVQLDLQTSEHLRLGNIEATIADKAIALTKTDDFGRGSLSLPSSLPPDVVLRLIVRAKALKPGDAELRVVATPGSNGSATETSEFTSIND